MIDWNPTISSVADHAKIHGQIPLIITPYCKASALEDLILRKATGDQFNLIVRFTTREITQGSTDLEIYNILIKHNYKLYAHPNIHLKLYVYGPETAFLTSANLTERGLGESHHRNLETGTMVSLCSYDWIRINQILDGSRLVTPELVEHLKEYQDEPDKLEELLKEFFSDKGLSMLDLPSLSKPEDFIRAFTGDIALKGNDLQRYLSDFSTYRADQFNVHDDPTEKLRTAFLAKPFIRAFSSHLKKKQSMRFGEVTQWFHDNISERPLPFRTEIKEMVGRIYNWICYFNNQVSWDIPGERSQVIKWEKIGPPVAQNPAWTQEELFLAIDTFLEIEEAKESISENNPRVIALSKKLNELKIHPPKERGENFRDPDGVRARISYFKRISEGNYPTDRPSYIRAWDSYHRNLTP